MWSRDRSKTTTPARMCGSSIAVTMCVSIRLRSAALLEKPWSDIWGIRTNCGCWRPKCRRFAAGSRRATTNLSGSTATDLPAHRKPRKDKFMDTRNPEGPRRPTLRTWSAFGNLGRRPSEYEIVTHKMNHTLRDTPLELGPDSPGNLWLVRHRDRLKLRVQDWDAFRDPDQLTYRKYVTCQDQSETYLDATIAEFARIGRAETGPEFLQTCLTPTRYLAHGL